MANQDWRLAVPPPLRALVVDSTARALRAVVTAESRTLEVGTGPGQYRFVVPGQFVGIDSATGRYREQIERRIDAAADAHALPFAASFDVVFFCNVFYMLDGERALAEARRVLKPNGRILIFDYSRKTLTGLASSSDQGPKAAVVNIRRAADWIELLSRGGFSGVRVTSSSLKWSRKMLRLLPRSVYFRLLDKREGAIIISGRL